MTQQMRERLLVDGIERAIECLPLESYPFKNDVFTRDANSMCTALSRGYVGNWALREDRLWLEFLSGLGDLFPSRDAPPPPKRLDLPAAWFTGEMYVYALDGEGHSEPCVALDWTFVEGQLLLAEEWEPEEAGVQRSRQRTVLEGVVWVRQTRLTRFAEEWCGPEEWPFVAALHEDLDDLSRRLVYADWLEERGDARAKLLRLETQLLAERGLRARSQIEPGWFHGSLGSVSPDNRAWIWRRLAGIPLPAPVDWAELRKEHRIYGPAPGGAPRAGKH